MTTDVIALPGMTPELAYYIVQAQDVTGIPADSLAAVMSAESGLKPGAANRRADGRLVAAGLIQLTTGAHLPGFATSDDLERVLTMSLADQFA